VSIGDVGMATRPVGLALSPTKLQLTLGDVPIASVNSSTLDVIFGAETSERVSADNALSIRIVSVENHVSSLSDIVSNLTSAHNALSNLVSGVGNLSNAVSIVSVAADVVSNAVSAISVKVDTLSNAVSALSALIGTQIRAISVDATVSATTLTDISGMSLSVETSGHYLFDAMLLYSTSVGQPVGFGLTFPGMEHTGGKIEMTLSTVASGPTQSTVNHVIGMWMSTGSGSMIISATSPGGGAAGVPVFYKGVFLVSSAAGVIQLLARASTGTGRIVLLRGSYMRLARIG